MIIPRIVLRGVFAGLDSFGLWILPQSCKVLGGVATAQDSIRSGTLLLPLPEEVFPQRTWEFGREHVAPSGARGMCRRVRVGCSGYNGHRSA